MNERERLGREIESAMKRKGLTLIQVSLGTGIPVSTIHRWICGDFPRGVIRFKNLIEVVGLKVDKISKS